MRNRLLCFLEGVCRESDSWKQKDVSFSRKRRVLKAEALSYYPRMTISNDITTEEPCRLWPHLHPYLCHGHNNNACHVLNLKSYTEKQKRKHIEKTQ